MANGRYLWRRLTPRQREEILDWRKSRERPWHSPPHRPVFGRSNFHVSAACYCHTPHIGLSRERLDSFSEDLLRVLAETGSTVHAWCVLPNHYHALVQSDRMRELFAEIGRLHGRTSFLWNAEENSRGRKVFYRATDRSIRSERHYWATMNYIHNNPVHHGYVKRWTEWPWSSAESYLIAVGRDEAERIWREYPLHDFGAKWDPADS